MRIGGVALGIPLRCTVMVLCVALSGCVTTVGYIPEYPKDASKPLPTYHEVQTWATNVIDGLDSRATMNRQALNYSAVIALGAASALTALAAFSPGSAALVGIPIGASFFGGVAAIYHSEEKAEIYTLATDSAKALKLFSENRLRQGRRAFAMPETEDAEAHLHATKAREEVKAKENVYKAAEARLHQATVPQDGLPIPPVPEERKKGIEQAHAALTKASVEVDRVRRVLMEAEAREKLAGTVKERRNTWATAEDAYQNSIRSGGDQRTVAHAKLARDHALVEWQALPIDLEQQEAICLHSYLDTLLAGVKTHMLLLDPKNLPDRFKHVGPSTDGQSGQPTETASSALSLDDLQPDRIKQQSLCPLISAGSADPGEAASPAPAAEPPEAAGHTQPPGDAPTPSAAPGPPEGATPGKPRERTP